MPSPPPPPSPPPVPSGGSDSGRLSPALDSRAWRSSASAEQLWAHPLNPSLAGAAITLPSARRSCSPGDGGAPRNLPAEVPSRARRTMRRTARTCPAGVRLSGGQHADRVGRSNYRRTRPARPTRSTRARTTDRRRTLPPTRDTTATPNTAATSPRSPPTRPAEAPARARRHATALRDALIGSSNSEGCSPTSACGGGCPQVQLGPCLCFTHASAEAGLHHAPGRMIA